MKLLNYLFLILLLCSCSEKTSLPIGEISTIPINTSLNNLVDDLLLSDAVSDIDVVFLEVNEDHLFRRMDHVLVTDSDIFIAPLLGEILRYNRKGEFINAIGKTGQGPTDIYGVMEISIDPSGQKLQALSAIRDDKVIDFSFEGNFISKKDFRISQFGFSSYKHIYYNENWFYLRLLQFPTAFSAEYFTILKYNSDKEEPLKFYNPANTGHEEDYIKHLTGNSVGNDEHLWEKYPQLVFYDGIGSVLFEHNDTIYRFNSAMDSLQMRYVMDCGDRPSFNLSHQYSQTDRSFFDYIYVNKLIESKDYIYLTVSQNTNRYLLQFDKVTGSTQGKVERRNIVSSRSNSNAYIQEDNPVGFTNDLCGGLSFYPDYINEKQWIARYEISDLKNGIDIEKLKKQDVLMPEKRDQLVKILENLDDEDNPILVIATLK